MTARHLDAAAVKGAIDPAAFYTAEFPGWTPKRAQAWNERRFSRRPIGPNLFEAGH